MVNCYFHSFLELIGLVKKEDDEVLFAIASELVEL